MEYINEFEFKAQKRILVSELTLEAPDKAFKEIIDLVKNRTEIEMLDDNYIIDGKWEQVAHNKFKARFFKSKDLISKSMFLLLEQKSLINELESCKEYIKALKDLADEKKVNVKDFNVKLGVKISELKED